MSSSDPTTERTCKCGQTAVCRGMCHPCYLRWRAAEQNAGTFSSLLVDAGPVRERLAELLASGLTPKEISKLGTVDLRRIHSLVGDTTVTKVHQLTADKIMSVPVPANSGPGLGARRRLQALVAIGYPFFELAHRMRVPDRELIDLAMRPPAAVDVDLDARIRALYDVLHLIPGPNDEARKLAWKLGWASSFAWDDNAALDDPNARPVGVPPRPTHSQIPADFPEIVADHRALGRSDPQIAAAMHITLDALHQRFRRFGVAEQEQVAS